MTERLLAACCLLSGDDSGVAPAVRPDRGPTRRVAAHPRPGLGKVSIMKHVSESARGWRPLEATGDRWRPRLDAWSVGAARPGDHQVVRVVG